MARPPDARLVPVDQSACSAGLRIFPRMSRYIAATTSAARMAGPMSEPTPMAAARFFSIPAPAKADICPGWISTEFHLLPDKGVAPPLGPDGRRLAVPADEGKLIRQGQKLFRYRSNERRAVPIGEIRAADRVAEQHIAEYPEIGFAIHKHHMARRV